MFSRVRNPSRVRSPWRGPVLAGAGGSGPTFPTIDDASWNESFPGTTPGDPGVFHWLRTRYGSTSELPLPQNGGQARGIASHVAYADQYAYRRCTDSSDPLTGGLSSMTISYEANNAWFGWDFGPCVTVDVSHYSLVASYPSIVPRSWVAEWSDDGTSWTPYDTHSSDTTMSSVTSAWYTFTPASSSGPHRYFRFRTTGGCADTRNFFAVSGIELYGDTTLDLVGGLGVDLRYSSDNMVGVHGYLGRLRNTESYIHPDSGSIAGISSSRGRGLIDAYLGGYPYGNSYYNTHMLDPEWATVETLAAATSDFDGGWNVDYGGRRRVRPTGYRFGYRTDYADYLETWKFEGSNDGVTWDVLDDQTIGVDYFPRHDRGEYGRYSNYQVFNVAPQSEYYQFFRIHGISGPQEAETSITTYEVFGTYQEDTVVLDSDGTRYEPQDTIDVFDDIHADIAPHMFSTTEVYNHSTWWYPEKTIDGSLSTGLIMANYADNVLVADYFPNTVRPESIVIGSATDGNHTLKNFDLEGSNDGFNWTVIKSITSAKTNDHAWRSLGNGTGLKSFQINCDDAYRMLRLHSLGTSWNDAYHMALSEWRVYGDVIEGSSVPEGDYDPFETWKPLVGSWASDPDWTPPADGAAVGTWPNEGLIGSDWTEATNKPLYRASVSALGNKPALQGSGTGGLTMTVPVGRSGNHSIVCIGNLPTSGGTQVMLYDGNGTGRKILYRPSGGDFTLYASGNGCAKTADNNMHLFTAYFNEGTSVLEIDGDTDGAATDSAGGSGNDTGYHLFSNYVNSDPSTGHIAFWMLVQGDVRSDPRWPDFKQWVIDFYGLSIENPGPQP